MDKSRIKVDCSWQEFCESVQWGRGGVGNNVAKTFEAKNLWPKPLTVSWESK